MINYVDEKNIQIFGPASGQPARRIVVWVDDRLFGGSPTKHAEPEARGPLRDWLIEGADSPLNICEESLLILYNGQPLCDVSGAMFLDEQLIPQQLDACERAQVDPGHAERLGDDWIKSWISSGVRRQCRELWCDGPDVVTVWVLDLADGGSGDASRMFENHGVVAYSLVAVHDNHYVVVFSHAKAAEPRWWRDEWLPSLQSCPELDGKIAKEDTGPGTHERIVGVPTTDYEIYTERVAGALKKWLGAGSPRD